MSNHTILFLAANPFGTDRLALDQEARAIQAELERCGYHDKFELVTRWAAQPLDLLHELRKLKPAVVHFSGHGGRAEAGERRSDAGPHRDIIGEPGVVDGDPQQGLFFQGPNGEPQLVSTAALAETFGAAGSSVTLVVLNACYSEVQAEALLAHVECVVGIRGLIDDQAARNFAIGFYGGIGEGESVAKAYKQGNAAISLQGLRDGKQPQLKVRLGIDADEIVLADPDMGKRLLSLIACPYPGMLPFSAQNASQFHGREREIDDLLGYIRSGDRQIIVVGTSGSGKSSLVAAGVIPRVQAGDRGALGYRFVVRAFRPGEHPTQRLADALECEVSDIDGAVASLLGATGADRMLLFVDQFEELFVLTDARERQRFVRALRVLRADHRCHLIAALRVEFYGLLMSSELWDDIDGRFTQFSITPVRGEALRAAIEAPARDVGVRLEVPLVERLMADAAGEPGALPLLQEALILLWKQCSLRLLRLKDYEALGRDGRSGLAVALARRADATMHELTLSQQALARRILLRLVSFGEGRPDTRRQQPRAALPTSGDHPDDFDEVLRRLIDGRMLTSDATAGGEPLVDISHEALIAGWPAFQSWLLSRREDERRRRTLELRVAAWTERGDETVGLFDEVEILEAERWITSETAQELGYHDDLRYFVAVSRTAIEAAAKLKQRATKQRWRLALSGAVVLIVLGVIGSRLALLAWREQDATRFQLGLHEQEQGRSLLVEGQDPVRAIPHLIAAVNLGGHNAVLRTLLAEVRRGVWKVAIRHAGPVSTAMFSPDGTRVVTASRDGTARVWDVGSGAPVSPPLRHVKPVNNAAFNADGTSVVTACVDGSARVWNVATGTLVGVPLEHRQEVRSATFSPDGTRVVTASEDGTARVWDARTGVPIGVPLQHEQAVRSAAFSPDGTQVVTASWDRTARVWEAATGMPVSAPLKHAQEVWSAVFSPDGTRVVTASADGTAQVWNAATGTPTGAPLKHEKAVLSAAFSSGGTRVVTASADGTARVWDAQTGMPVGAPLRHEREVWSAAFSADGTRVVTASTDCTARVWDAATGAAVGVPLTHEQTVWNAAFSADGTRVVTASRDGTARVWDASVGMPTGVPITPWQAVRHAAFSPDGMTLVTASADRTVRIWDARTGALVGVPLEHESEVHHAAFSSDGTRVVTASANGTARLWDVRTGRPLDILFVHEQAINSAEFSTDGTRVVTASSDGTARVWDARTGMALKVVFVHEQAVNSAEFDRDGTHVVTASADGTARVWDAQTGQPVGMPFTHEQAVTSAGFSGDGTRVVTSSLDGMARVWNVRTGTRLGMPLMHEQRISRAAFSPNGTRVVTASADGTARLWDAATGMRVGVPLKHGGQVLGASFNPDGTRVATVSSDGTARVWDVAVPREDIPGWVERAVKCVLPEPGASAACPLSDHETVSADQVARMNSLLIVGDLALFSRVWSVSRARYQDALAVLDGNRAGSSFPSADRVELVRAVSWRMERLDALAGRSQSSRFSVGSDAPVSLLRLPTLDMCALGQTVF